jgi:hypothetical protein
LRRCSGAATARSGSAARSLGVVLGVVAIMLLPFVSAPRADDPDEELQRWLQTTAREKMRHRLLSERRPPGPGGRADERILHRRTSGRTAARRRLVHDVESPVQSALDSYYGNANVDDCGEDCLIDLTTGVDGVNWMEGQDNAPTFSSGRPNSAAYLPENNSSWLGVSDDTRRLLFVHVAFEIDEPICAEFDLDFTAKDECVFFPDAP